MWIKWQERWRKQYSSSQTAMKVKTWAITTTEPDYSPLKQFLEKEDLETSF